ncbi:hypothetical protein B0T26DRAFT_868436 [Lasiosphaeria miniovina]|uniref:Stf2-like protein n=1 Tax=Lasiosphaeria miniovina TaxID=1954250 RepID=A0AA40B3N4_9PEZI|nr:uncharacterized protein B0T26DRAFT_868436 [Lasiosphaeria miniovina]KAK0727059.1 hypothetical protein B0T26DRAFT_868436 [Lasiosphaeria miniovina]
MGKLDVWDGRCELLTRSHKFNDKDHAGLADGTVLPQENVPKFFAKNGFADVDPKKTKKNGGGKGNWGNAGEEVIDEPFNFTNSRRRSNSSGFSTHPENLRTKFEFNEPEPVFEESLHGPEGDDELKTESSSSGASVDGEKGVKDM